MEKLIKFIENIGGKNLMKIAQELKSREYNKKSEMTHL